MIVLNKNKKFPFNKYRLKVIECLMHIDISRHS